MQPIQRELTGVIKEVDGDKWAPTSPISPVSAANAAQFRKKRNAPKKAKAVDCITVEPDRHAAGNGPDL